MNYKLKHLSKYCTKPETELEFEAIKMAAEIGGVDVCNDIEYPLDTNFPVLWFDHDERWILSARQDKETLIPVLDFCNKIRMTEEEARELEDDRVSFHNEDAIKWMWSDKRMSIEIQNGFKATVNEDGTEVTLHKR